MDAHDRVYDARGGTRAEGECDATHAGLEAVLETEGGGGVHGDRKPGGGGVRGRGSAARPGKLLRLGLGLVPLGPRTTRDTRVW